MNAVNPRVDAYIAKSKKWREELESLRRILLEGGLAEDFKWGKPCYTYEGGNVAILIGFSQYCALGFFKGSLLRDAQGVLVSPGENSQAMRQFRFTDVRQIAQMEAIVRAYILEAVEVEKAGLKVEFKEKAELVFPPEFQGKLDENPALKAAFEALTPGRQRAYNLFFCAPKQSKTREARVDKCVPRILDGKGLNDP